jgi:polyferredoxin
MDTSKLSRVFQYSVKIFILAYATYLAVIHQLRGVLEAANAHAYCPFGGLESIYKLILSGGYIEKIMPATMILLGITVLLVVLLNRAFCGWICPLGTLQTLFDRLARFLKIKKVQVPQNIERWLQYLKYAVLVVILYFTWRLGTLVYAPYDPWAAYAHIAAGWAELYEGFLIGLLFLIVALVGSLWLPNNFCRYFCPMGAFLGILSKFSPTRIARNKKTCIDCKKCDGICPSQIQISTKPVVSSPECLACGDCVANCPVKKTLEFSASRNIRLPWLVYGILTLVLFFGPVWIAEQLGYWKTNYSSATEALTDQSGKLDPTKIKGSMTLEMVSKEFNVPVEVILKKFNLPADTKTNEMLKNIAIQNKMATEGTGGFVSGVRTFIAESIGFSAGTPIGPASMPPAVSAPAPAATSKVEPAMPLSTTVPAASKKPASAQPTASAGPSSGATSPASQKAPVYTKARVSERNPSPRLQKKTI